MVDPIMSAHLGNLMLRLKKQLNLTSVVVTHDLDLMRKVADKVVFLFESPVIYFGPTGTRPRRAPTHPGVSRDGSGLELLLIAGAFESCR